MNVKDYVLEYLQREYTFPSDVDPLSINYIEQGYVDSLGLIQFITTLEDEFNIMFSDEDLENPDIRIVGKLIEIIESKIV